MHEALSFSSSVEKQTDLKNLSLFVNGEVLYEEVSACLHLMMSFALTPMATTSFVTRPIPA